MLRTRSGQSLVEFVIALAIGIILIVGGIAALAPLFKSSGDVLRIQTASSLGRQLLENVRVLSESNWHAIDSLSSGSANKYYVIASTSPFTVVTGTEAVAVSTSTYNRYFYLEDVSRDSGGQISTSGSFPDPSTKKITVVYAWPAATAASNTIVSYLARTFDTSFFTDNWADGGNQSGPITATGTNARFATSSNIDYTAHYGSLVITGY